jgi:hypothetical protein
VSITRSGGYTGMRLAASVDTDELPPADARAALVALERLTLSPPTSTAAPSQPRYRLSFVQDSGEQVVEVAESQIPPALRPLITEFLRHPHPQDPPHPRQR